VPDTRALLQARKSDLMAALRRLEQDRAEGTVDARAYQRARQRYEQEAAGVLERLDLLTDAGGARQNSRQPSAGSRLGGIAAGAILALAVGLALLAAIHQRTAGGAATGSAPPALGAPTATPSRQLVAAERRVRLAPHSVDAILDLGNALLASNRTQAADEQFVKAMRLDPTRPEPPTSHALVLGSMLGRVTPALTLLRGVEAYHPRYTRAWLIDGLLSSRLTAGRHRAVAAFERFLALEPHGTVSPEVRSMLVALRRSGTR